MNEIPYILVRSKRKTIELSIDNDAQLVVRAPMNLGEDAIRDFIHKNAEWIDNKQHEVSNLVKYSAFILEDGASIPYCGKYRTVFLKDIAEVTVLGEFIFVPKSMTQEDFAEWMKNQAGEIIQKRLDYYANRMYARYTSVRMTGAKQRSGSCGAGNTLNFAWRLVMCPQWVVDYVVVHELSHLIYKNHSKRFWNYVAMAMPNYKEAAEWLEQNRRIMEVI